MTTLLLVDDDPVFSGVLQRALTRRDFNVRVAHNMANALKHAKDCLPQWAVVDLRLKEESGLTLIPKLLNINPQLRIVVLTGYASIATAIEAIKLGAIHYLTKPTDADEIIAAFGNDNGNTDTPLPNKRIPLQQLEWEHIQKTLIECDGNISAAARQLGLHRRTLQRKLQKRPTGNIG